MRREIYIIAGATASGKSARAITLAQKYNGVIINADATQLYTELPILSAQPNMTELAQAPHKLYGVINGDSSASAGSWLNMAKKEITSAWQNNKLPIICGGTGLYIKTLIEGIAPIPNIATTYRQQARLMMQNLGPKAMHSKLAQIDASSAAKINTGDSQRITRAYEVWLATNIPLSKWQKMPKQQAFPEAHFTCEIINLPRAELYNRCNMRFIRMIECGALEEVKQLLDKNYTADIPIMKALGVPELAAFLAGKIPLDDAIALAQRNTRRYAKRQITWFNNQLTSQNTKLTII